MVLQSRLGISKSVLVGSTMAAGVPAGDPLAQNIVQQLELSHVTGKFASASDTMVLVHGATFDLLIDDIKKSVPDPRFNAAS